MQRLAHAHPVRTVAAGVVIPFMIMARGQAAQLLGGLGLALLLERVLLIALLYEFPYLAIVVAVIYYGVLEVSLGELIALSARLGHERNREIGHLPGAHVAFAHQRVEALGKFDDVRIVIGMLLVERGTRQHRQAMAYAGFKLGITGVFSRDRVQRHEDPTQTGILAHSKIFDAAVLQELRCHALEGTEIVRKNRGGPAAMRGDVSQRGTVAVDAGYAVRITVYVGQAYAELVIVGNGLAQFIERAGIGNQLILVLPQTAQI